VGGFVAGLVLFALFDPIAPARDGKIEQKSETDAG
jgi:hypothetical protein